MRNLLALGAGILSSNSIPGVHLLFREAGEQPAQG